jgi:hypothetical protein
MRYDMRKDGFGMMVADGLGVDSAFMYPELGSKSGVTEKWYGVM